MVRLQSVKKQPFLNFEQAKIHCNRKSVLKYRLFISRMLYSLESSLFAHQSATSISSAFSKVTGKACSLLIF